MWAAFVTVIFGAGAATAAPRADHFEQPRTLASQGNAKAGKPCVFRGRGNNSAAIGSPLDGLPDTPGVNGNEINDVFFITEMPARANGSGTHLGFLTTTFNHENFYQFPIWASGANTPVVLNLGNLAIHPKAEMPARTWLDIVNRALARSGPLSGNMKAAHDAAERFQARASRSGTVTITSCFDGPWDGRTS